jgi:hypothetical protein
MTDEKQRGGSSIEILLDDVTIEEVEALTEKIADLLVGDGLGAARVGEDPEIVRSILLVRGYEWPETEAELFEYCRDASMIVFPCEDTDGGEK